MRPIVQDLASLYTRYRDLDITPHVTQIFSSARSYGGFANVHTATWFNREEHTAPQKVRDQATRSKSRDVCTHPRQVAVKILRFSRVDATILRVRLFAGPLAAKLIFN